jgi:two-component system, sensor histidine kinase
MRRSADSLLRILDDILDTARLENGKIEIRPAPFDLRRLIANVAALHFPAARTKGLEEICRVEDDVPQWVEGDVTRLRQVLSNLLGNAVKFTSAGRVALEVAADGAPPGPAWVEFCVSDTGIGIPPEVREKLFKPFSQASGATNRLFGGTGLGLAISAQLVELMGGKITLVSDSGRGTRFSFRLPLEPTSSPDETLAEIRLPAGGQSLRVLVAEDHPVNQVVARRLLEKLGYAVDVAADGEAAVAAAARTPYAAILMDCQMPRMDGFAATAEIRRQSGARRVPIVAITANAMPGDRERCLAADMDDFLAKPVQLAALAETLRRWTEAGFSAPESPISPAPAVAAATTEAPGQTRSP